MKRSLFILSVIALIGFISSCQQKIDELISENPYLEGTRKLNISLVYPEAFKHELKEGVNITVVNPTNGAVYNLLSDKQGKASLELQYGFYKSLLQIRALLFPEQFLFLTEV